MTLRVVAEVPERDVSVELEIADGETVALLGGNGAGKSTVLGVIAGQLRARGARVTLGDRVLTGRGTWVPPHARDVALLAQEALLFPHLTVGANVAFGPRSRGAGRRRARASAEEWLARVGVPELASRRPAELSGGQAQRVAVARALAADPQVLLLDEPMAALDVNVTPALRHLLREVLQDRTTVIATHDVLDALLLADRVVVLDGGRVVEEGPTAEVLARPRSAFAAQIAGLNLLAGRWDGEALVADGARVEGRVEGGERTPVVVGDEVVAVFRPSAVSVYLAAPTGSPRNAFPVVVTALEPFGDQVRVRGGGMSALITPHAAAELALAPGGQVTFIVKASEVDLYLR
ncbi:sulfate/molybdate ABC transporter ATP-binding protein [Nocardioides cavernaquae]|uniref:ATP-binding cassette domain-containing protein n=1 Tax=Nocardioides cavernaquae TaxID=2321396 RepID=A0A3A5H685_9ACTN|nr:ATP-binding cassette domain-containing protein [Nocardioides cavernaquae]RJS46062.1 ATP-binding cassette domain-containing protein [Nocardioides cavernaquae]